MSTPYESGKPLRRGSVARGRQQEAQYRSAPNLWKERKVVGTVLRYCGIEGGVKASELGVQTARAAEGGVWVEVNHESFPYPISVWVADTISDIMAKVGGNLVGKRVEVTFRGRSATSIENGYCRFIGSGKERYPHPDQQSSPVSVGAFQGASCTPESYAVFAGSEYSGEEQ